MQKMIETYLYLFSNRIKGVLNMKTVVLDCNTVVSNGDISLDPIEGIPLVCQKDVKSVKMLSPDGKWEAVEFTKRDGIITVDTTAYTLDPVMLILE